MNLRIQRNKNPMEFKGLFHVFLSFSVCNCVKKSFLVQYVCLCRRMGIERMYDGPSFDRITKRGGREGEREKENYEIDTFACFHMKFQHDILRYIFARYSDETEFSMTLTLVMTITIVINCIWQLYLWNL